VEIILSTLIILVFFLLIFLVYLRKTSCQRKKNPTNATWQGFHMRKVVKEILGKSDGGKAILDKMNVNKLTSQYHKLVIF